LASSDEPRHGVSAKMLGVNKTDFAEPSPVRIALKASGERIIEYSDMIDEMLHL